MNMLVMDFETTGLILRGTPSLDPGQPHIVEAAAFLADLETGEIDESSVWTRIVKPDRWIIPEETVRIHGITTERAHAEGIPEAQVLLEFMRLAVRAEERVAHNQEFDARIVRIALKRYWGDEKAEEWRTRPRPSCTKVMAQQTKRFRYNGLNDVHRALFHCDAVDLHKGLADARACHAVWRQLRGEVELLSPVREYDKAIRTAFDG